MRHPAFALLTALALGCETQAPVYDYGVDLDSVEFNLFDAAMGVHPSNSILLDPNNPFAQTGVSDVAKWEILEAERWPATFYAWGTIAANQPHGEAQFYTANAAAQMYDRREVETEDLYYVWRIAVDGYQAVLDHFPESVTYDASGEIAYPLAPLAYNGIVALGGEPEGWTLVTGDDGSVTVVPLGGAEASEGEE